MSELKLVERFEEISDEEKANRKAQAIAELNARQQSETKAAERRELLDLEDKTWTRKENAVLALKKLGHDPSLSTCPYAVVPSQYEAGRYCVVKDEDGRIREKQGRPPLTSRAYTTYFAAWRAIKSSGFSVRSEQCPYAVKRIDERWFTIIEKPKREKTTPDESSPAEDYLSTHEPIQ